MVPVEDVFLLLFELFDVHDFGEVELVDEVEALDVDVEDFELLGVVVFGLG